MPSAASTEPWARTTATINPRTISDTYSAGPNSSAIWASGGAKSAMKNVADDARENRTKRRDRERRSGPPLARHLVAVETGDDRCGFARHVHQDRRGRTAELGTVIDAGEHDQRRLRLQVVADRQQHRHGVERPEPRQDADHRSEQTANQAVQQVARLESHGKAMRKARQACQAYPRSASPEVWRPDRDRQTKRLDEEKRRKHSRAEGQCQSFIKFRAAVRRARDENKPRQGDHKPHSLDRDAKKSDCGQNHEGTQVPALMRLANAQEAAADEQCPQSELDRREHPRHKTWPQPNLCEAAETRHDK